MNRLRFNCEDLAKLETECEVAQRVLIQLGRHLEESNIRQTKASRYSADVIWPVVALGNKLSRVQRLLYRERERHLKQHDCQPKTRRLVAG